MYDLRTMLSNADPAMIYLLPQIWGVDTSNLKKEDVQNALYEAMQDPTHIEKVWDGLDERARQALQNLYASKRVMPVSQFTILYSPHRRMGRAQIDRELPHKNPQSITEALYYRGFIAETNEDTPTGLRPVFYIPLELAENIPWHKTQYQDLESMSDEDFFDEDDEHPEVGHLVILEEEDLDSVHPADTSLVDDMTTLLAYLRVHTAAVEGDSFLPVDVERLLPHMLRVDEARLTFMLGIGAAGDLITTSEGRAYPKRTNLNTWLSAPRWQQVQMLAQMWRDGILYQDLWHVPALYPDPDAGAQYDTRQARQAVLEFLQQFAPAKDWWSISDFIDLVKENDPDFQRPGGDYDSWYIRNQEGEYLHGYESWDAVDGALLEFIIEGPMHWLGLMDVAEDAARLTAYGRAFLEMMAWPQPPERNETIKILDDGLMLASRHVARVDRFQVARFSTWQAAGEEYAYKMDADGLQAGVAQGITPAHIQRFLERHHEGKPLPPAIIRLLSNWQDGATADVSMERVIILRTHSADTLDKIYEKPTLRRHLGARLGEMAGIVLAERADALRDALGEEGINVEIMGQ
jgi:hypothetical protein